MKKILNPIKNGCKKFANGFKTSKKFRIISIILIVAIIAGSIFGGKLLFGSSDTQVQKVYAQVTRGTINNVIEGTGTVQAISQYEITSLAKGDVIADYFEVGDYVVKDQLLYEIDSASMDKSISRQQSNVEKAAANYAEAIDNVANLRVKSTIGGVVSTMYVSVGDNVQQGTKIADVINKDNLTITLPFGKFDAKNMQVGNSAEVTLSKSLTTVSGVVTKVATGAYVNDYGVEVTDVEIEFANPGTVTQGETVSAVVGGYACYDTAQVEYIASKTITAKTSGEVIAIYKGKGDSVRSGEVMVLLESSSVSRSSRDAAMSLQDANLSLDDLYDSLEDYSIKSPIDGKVIQKNIKAGEKLDSNSSSAMAIVADLSKLTFDISIDELDISDISVGQMVSITADALPGQRFTGEISNISIVGSAYQGVTSYPVTVTIDNTQESDLIPGMNVSAQIIVESAENVLRIPVSAVNMGNLVIVKDDGTFMDPVEMAKKQMSSFAGSMSRKNSTETESQKEVEKTTDEKTQQSQMPQGEYGQRPQMPQGEYGQRPQMPQGEGGQRPQMSQGEGGQRPQMPQGEYGQKSNAPQTGSARESESTEDKSTQQPKQSQETNSKQDKTSKTSQASAQDGEKGENMEDKTAERIKTMIENLDVPEGYTVVMVQTGLTDGSFIEIKEIEGSLKEGDTIVLNVVTQSSATASSNGMGGMPGGMGGMPGGMGGMSGGMRTGMPSGMSGGNRSGMSGGMSSNRNSMR